jgi:hypothetical protein
MIEIDHTALPEPAKPVLASHLLVIEENQRKRFAEQGLERVKTGCAEVDDYVLGGGFERGIVVGLSGEGNEGRLVGAYLHPLFVRMGSNRVIRKAPGLKHVRTCPRLLQANLEAA